MLKRTVGPEFSQRLLWLLIAVAFASTAVVHAVLAGTMSEWWPIVAAVLLAIPAVLCAVLAARNDHRNLR